MNNSHSASRNPAALAAFFGVCLIACLVGCVKTDNPPAGNQPTNDRPTGNAPVGLQPAEQAAPPATAADRLAPWQRPRLDAAVGDIPWDEWVHASPFQAKMRSMWVSCGLIVGNAMFPEISDTVLLEAAARDIANKARGFAEHFEKCRDLNRDATVAARAGEWDKAVTALDRVNRACENCHYENWPLRTRGFIPETLKGWKDADTVFEDEPWEEMKLHSPVPLLRMMYGLRGQLTLAQFYAVRRSESQLRTATGKMHKPLDEQANIWRAIEAQANSIVALAEQGLLADVGNHYLTMTRLCADCHKEWSDSRGIDPLPWK